MTKLEKSMDVTKCVASVAVYDLKAMIMSLQTDERLMTPENIAHGYDFFTGKSIGDLHELGEIHTGDTWQPACQRFCGDDWHNSLHAAFSSLKNLFH